MSEAEWINLHKEKRRKNKHRKEKDIFDDIIYEKRTRRKLNKR